MRYLTILFFLFLLFAGCEPQASREGDVLFESGDYEGAIRAYSEYLTLYPTDVKSLYNRGRAYEEMELYELSFKDFQAVLEEDEENLQANLSVGGYYYRKNDLPNALYYYERAVQYQESNAQAHFLLARVQHKLGKKEEAMKGYNTAISLNSELGEAYLYRGVLYTFLNQHRRACEDYRQAQILQVPEAEIQINNFCN